MMTLLLRSWALRQNNRTEADELRRLAKQAGATDPEAWAARVLEFAKRQEPAVPPLWVGRAIALGQQIGRGVTPDLSSLRQLAQDYSAVRSNVPAISVAGTWRSADAARAAFNYPSHWLNQGGGKLAPNEARLQGQSQQAWQALTDKYGSALAKTLFDAKVRGGNPMAVINAMQAAGTSKTLTIRDLTYLQYVAITDGKASDGPLPINDPSFHDAFHTYGVSDFEEAFGDAHTEKMVVRLFGSDSKIGLNPARSLLTQAVSVQKIKAALIEERATALNDDLGSAVRAAFFRQNWALSPASNPTQAQKLLNGSGALAHLSAPELQKVSSLLFDRRDPQSMASISASFQATGDQATLAAHTAQWTDTLANLVASAAMRQAPTQRQFNEQSAQAIALALTLERASPGALKRAPVVSGVSDAELAPALRELDLLKAYPAVLREVRQALDLTP